MGEIDELYDRYAYTNNIFLDEVEKLRKKSVYAYYIEKAKSPIVFGNIIILAQDSYDLFPKEKPVFDSILGDDFFNEEYWHIESIKEFLDYLWKLIKKKRDYEKNKFDERKIFLTANDRIRVAAKAFKQDNYSSCISNIHTALEITLKDKLKIPPTINEIKIGPLVGFCIRNSVFPELTLFLKELNHKANIIDNEFKHKSYNPSKSEALEALNLGEKFVSEAEKLDPKLPKNFYEELSQNIKYLSKK